MRIRTGGDRRLPASPAGRGLSTNLSTTSVYRAPARGQPPAADSCRRSAVHADDVGRCTNEGERVVPHTGFEPVISALRGRCPRPLDECGVASGGGTPEPVGLIPTARATLQPR